jgi:hypothetical protein
MTEWNRSTNFGSRELRPEFRCGEALLQVKRFAEDLFVAIATPPGANEDWFKSEPLRAHKLLKQLNKRGCHSIDIAKALNEQDPQWIKKAQGPYE